MIRGMFVLASDTVVNCGKGSTLVNVIAIVRLVMNIICIAVPIIMILMGTLDLFKAVTAGKDEDIKNKQKALITRIIAGVLVFLVPTIVSVIMDLIGVSSWRKCWNEAANENFKSLFQSGNVSDE